MRNLMLGAVAAALLAGEPMAAEPEKLLSATLPAGGEGGGRLIRTAEGLALLDPEGLTPLEGGRRAVRWPKDMVIPVEPGSRWILGVETPRTGGFMEPQKRGPIRLGDLDAANPFPEVKPPYLHMAAWPYAAADGPDGSLLMVLWAKAPPFVTEPGYRLVLWSPTAPAKVADWPEAWRDIGQGQLMADGQGGWRLLTRLGQDACGRAAGVAVLSISADLKVSEGDKLCLPDTYTAFTTEVLAGASTPSGPVWFVSGKSAGAHRLARITVTATGLKAKSLAELPAGSVASTAYDPTTGDLYVAQDNGARLTRIDPKGKTTDVDLPAPSCDGGKAGGKRSASLATLDGRVHLAVTAGSCVNVWRF